MHFFRSTDQAKKNQTPTVGILQLTSHPALDEIHRGIVAALKEEGFVAGKNIKIDFQNAQNDQSNLKSMSQRFENEDAAVMIGIATPAAQSLANTTKTTPIVMGAISDPIGAGLVKDLKHPGGNITGVQHREPIARQLQLIKMIMPNLKTVGVLHTSSDDSSAAEVKEFSKLAQKRGSKSKNTRSLRLMTSNKFPLQWQATFKRSIFQTTTLWLQAFKRSSKMLTKIRSRSFLQLLK